MGSGAFALYKTDPFHIFTSGPQAAEAIPADAVFYVGVDLDPSATQKVNALRFLNHFPAFKEASGVKDANTDIRKTIFDKALEASPCGDLTYDADVRPWLGSKFALAGMPPESDNNQPTPVFAIEVSDEAAAAKGLEKLAACGPDSGDFGIAFTGDYALVAETQDQADKYADAAGSKSLADDADFKADMDALGDLGVATGWVDIDGAIDLFGSDLALTGSDSGLDFLRSSYQRAAVTFRFESDHAEFATSVYGDTPDISHSENQIVNLPDSAVFAASEAGGGARLSASWDNIMKAAKSSGADIEGQIADFEAKTGLSVPDDIETVLGDNLMFALDSEGLTADAIQAQDPTLLNAGVRFTGDKDQLNSIYDKVLGLVQDEAGADVPFTKTETDDGLVIATNDSYADKLSGDGSLGDTDAFTSVVDNGGDQEFVVFFNWDAVEDQALQAAQNSGAPQEVIDNLRPLQAIGLSSDTDGHYNNSTFVVSVND